jgi:hypothetical protein
MSINPQQLTLKDTYRLSPADGAGHRHWRCSNSSLKPLKTPNTEASPGQLIAVQPDKSHTIDASQSQVVCTCSLMLKVFWPIPNESHIHADSKLLLKVQTCLSTTTFVRVANTLIRSTPRQSKQRDFHFASPFLKLLLRRRSHFKQMSIMLSLGYDQGHLFLRCANSRTPLKQLSRRKSHWNLVLHLVHTAAALQGCCTCRILLHDPLSTACHHPLPQVLSIKTQLVNTSRCYSATGKS